MPSLLNYLQDCRGEGCNVVPVVRSAANQLVAAVPQNIGNKIADSAQKSLTQLVSTYQPPSLNKVVGALRAAY
jgi:hypothetical protein